MEQRYWEQFTKTGGVCDYLVYKMEVYGHGGIIADGHNGNAGRGEDFERDNGNRHGAVYGTGGGI